MKAVEKIVGKDILVSFTNYSIDSRLQVLLNNERHDDSAIPYMPNSIVYTKKNPSLFKAILKYIKDYCDRRGKTFDFLNVARRYYKVIKYYKRNYRRVGDSRENEITLNITKNIDWEAGDFGDYDSCFWGGRSGARDMLKKYGAYAVKIFDEDGDNYGRFWLAPFKNKDYGHGFVAFNMYRVEGVSEIPLNVIIESLSEQLEGLEFSPFVNLLNKNKSSGTLFINGGTGYVLSEKKSNKTIDLGWHEVKTYQCVMCNISLGSEIEDIIFDALDRSWCEEHAFEMLDICNYDDKLYEKKNLVTGPDGLNYSSNNIGQVEKFVMVLPSKEYVFKEEARELVLDSGESVWVKKNEKYEICRGCEGLHTNETGYCDYCKQYEEILEEMNDEGFDLFHSQWDLPKDYDKLVRYHEFLVRIRTILEKRDS